MTILEENNNDNNNLRELTRIVGRRDNLKERLEHVEDILDREPETLSKFNESVVDRGDNLSDYSVYLEQLGTYLINSKDINSCRSLEYSFYENELRYKQYAIGKATFPIDVSDSRSTLSDIYVEDEYFYDEPQIILDLSELDNKQLKKVIQNGIIEKNFPESKLNLFMSKLYDYMIVELDKDCIDIFELIIKNKNDREISESISIPRRTVTYRVKKIIDKVGGFVYE